MSNTSSDSVESSGMHVFNILLDLSQHAKRLRNFPTRILQSLQLHFFLAGENTTLHGDARITAAA